MTALRLPARAASAAPIVLAGWMLAGAVLAAEDKPAAAPPGPVSYYRDVRPILVDNCQGCHQPAKAGGKVVLVRHADLFAPPAGDGAGERKAVVAPGKPAESLLYTAIVADGGSPPEMPKDQPPLSAEKVETIRRWIEEGAADDTPESARVVVSQEKPPVYLTPPVVTALDYSPDATLLAVAGYHEVLLHRADGNELLARLVGQAERVESVVFSPDGKLLAVAGGTPCIAGELQVWEVEKRKLKTSVSVTHDTVYGASWSPDGTLVALGCADNTVRAFEAATGKQVLFNGAHNDWVLDTVFSTDGSHLVSVSRDRSLKLIEVKTQQFIDNITSITPGALAGGLISVDRHPSRDEALIAGADGIPKVYKLYRTQARQIGDDFNLIRKYEGLSGRVFSARFAPDGNRFAVGSSDSRNGEVRVYQTEDGKMVSRWISPCAVYAIAIAADGKTVAAAGFDGFVRLLQADDGKLVRELMPVPLETPLKAL